MIQNWLKEKKSERPWAVGFLFYVQNQISSFLHLMNSLLTLSTSHIFTLWSYNNSVKWNGFQSLNMRLRHVWKLESSLSKVNISCEVINVIIPCNESTLKSAYFLKSAFLESFSSTVTKIKSITKLMVILKANYLNLLTIDPFMVVRACWVIRTRWKTKSFNKTIARWCHFTTTTRILEFVVFLCKLRLLFFNPQRDWQI